MSKDGDKNLPLSGESYIRFGQKIGNLNHIILASRDTIEREKKILPLLHN